MSNTSVFKTGLKMISSSSNTKLKDVNLNTKSKSSRTTAQGTTRYCKLCKKAGMPYGKYSSHSTSQCKDATKMKAKVSGGVKDRAEATNSWKKEYKMVAKQIKLLKKQNKQLMKILKKSTSGALAQRIRYNSSSTWFYASGTRALDQTTGI